MLGKQFHVLKQQSCVLPERRVTQILAGWGWAQIDVTKCDLGWAGSCPSWFHRVSRCRLGDWAPCVSRDPEGFGLGMSLRNNQRARAERKQKRLPEAQTESAHCCFTSSRHSQEKWDVWSICLESSQSKAKAEEPGRNWSTGANDTSYHKSPIHSFRNVPSQNFSFLLVSGIMSCGSLRWSSTHIPQWEEETGHGMWGECTDRRWREMLQGCTLPRGPHHSTSASSSTHPVIWLFRSLFLRCYLQIHNLDLLSVKCYPKCSEQ